MLPGVIKKLDKDVVNRIAAGEIILRPANALKELIENSLDAKASSIQITVKAGGLKLLQIQDNGTGIRREDLEIVCERFTTSKLSTFDDLTSIATFGFRGEALSSISHVSHFTIQTKTVHDKCGYKANYKDGKLTAPPKPCAGNQGTLITIEDLFYNMPQRKQGLKSPTEEFQRISDVVTKYAVHNAHVAFLMKRAGENPSVRTMVNSTTKENIRQVFGAQIAKELMEVRHTDAVYKFSMNAMITAVNYAAKSRIMLLFINHRLVESPALKVAVDSVYDTYLPKGMHPFVYLSLELQPSNIDVNVHPTKHEVHFLYEDEIIESIRAQIESKLLGSNSTRTFYKQLKLPGTPNEGSASPDTKTAANTSATDGSQRVQPKDVVRTDAKEQKLERFLISQNSSMKDKLNASNDDASSIGDISIRSVSASKPKKVRLTSVLKMQKEAEGKCSITLRKILKDMVFLGVVDEKFALLQHEATLYMCNTLQYSEEFFYQRLIYDFENFAQISLEPSLPLKQLLMVALDTDESDWSADDGDKSELADSAVRILVSKAQIMREYFGVRITADGMLESLPSLLAEHRPCTTFLPIYVLRLATDVEWDEEEECFETFCRETANFYARMSQAETRKDPKRHKWFVEHVLYPAFKRSLLPPNKLRDHLYTLTNLSTLYKVFERC